jgi:hypothetical protein
MEALVKRKVRERAGNRCEYCLLPQSALPNASFHLEHITACQHGGGDDLDNLALACDRCNLYKGPNLAAIDPITGNIVPLFNPRKETWEAHFMYTGAEIIGRTDIGRATARLLNMNAPRRVRLRTLLRLGERPTA